MAKENKPRYKVGDQFKVTLEISEVHTYDDPDELPYYDLRFGGCFGKVHEDCYGYDEEELDELFNPAYRREKLQKQIEQLQKELEEVES